jgi:ribosome-binding ATPase YchF (GTP1/OBG family)
MDELGLTTHRPLITVVNVAEEHLGTPVPAEVTEAARKVGSGVLWLCAAIEAEIAAIDNPDERADFLAAYSLTRPASERFVQTAFTLLDQISFFTVGPDEVRAWPIASGTRARRAARTIHSDLERGFIRAEVIRYPDFLKHGSEAACRSAGVLRTEGKDYVVQDGDIITVRFNI